MNQKIVLITGANSYIGTSFEKYITKWNLEHPNDDHLIINTLDMQSPSWKEYDFSKYDSILHLAGIVHQKETESNRELYFKVNRDLAFETAKKAKEAGVKQFIYFSTMSVYGLLTGVIDKNTPENPTNAYGKSKLEGEKLIKSIEDDKFKVAIVRPPMIYGEGCKGNYQTLCKIVDFSPIFPDFPNQRSLISIENLCNFLFDIIKNENQGLFLPQNPEYISTTSLVKKIANYKGKKIRFTKLFNPIISFFQKQSNAIGIQCQKAFGNLIYKKSRI